MRKPMVYFLEGREVHMIGDYVGVCWNLDYRELVRRDGRRTKVPIRRGTPYFAFLTIHDDGNGPYKAEDSPVVGGMRLRKVIQLVMELTAAIEYLTTFKQG